MHWPGHLIGAQLKAWRQGLPETSCDPSEEWKHFGSRMISSTDWPGKLNRSPVFPGMKVAGKSVYFWHSLDIWARMNDYKSYRAGDDSA